MIEYKNQINMLPKKKPNQYKPKLQEESNSLQSLRVLLAVGEV